MSGQYDSDFFCYNMNDDGTCFNSSPLVFMGADQTSHGLWGLQGIIGLAPKQLNSELFLNQAKSNGDYT